MPERLVRDAHGRVGLVDVLPAVPPRPETSRRRGDRPGSISMSPASSSTGITSTRANDVLAPVAGVERRLANQPMHAALGLEIAVGKVALDLHRGALDAGLFTGRHVDDRGAVLAPLRPARVHAQQHLGPVLTLGPTGPSDWMGEGRRRGRRTPHRAAAASRAHPGAASAPMFRMRPRRACRRHRRPPIPPAPRPRPPQIPARPRFSIRDFRRVISRMVSRARI